VFFDPQGCYNIPVVIGDFHLPHGDMDIPMGSWVAVEPSGTRLPSMLKNPKPFWAIALIKGFGLGCSGHHSIPRSLHTKI